MGLKQLWYGLAALTWLAAVAGATLYLRSLDLHAVLRVVAAVWAVVAFTLCVVAQFAIWEKWRDWIGQKEVPWRRIMEACAQTAAALAFFGTGIAGAVWFVWGG